jgi:ABC-2 type transport system permease protein
VTLAYVHARAQVLELLRYPSYSVPTLAFPALLYLLFGTGADDADAGRVMASFAAFAVLTVAFFQFGVGVALMRVSPWELYLRTLPVSPRIRIAGGLAAGLPFAVASAGAVIVLALLVNAPALGSAEWLRLAVVLAAGSIPLALMGLTLGYWARPRSALPLANLLNLGLAFAGGLWFAPAELPKPFDAVSPYLPTRQWGELLWDAVEGRPWSAGPFLWLGGYAAAFFGAAAAGYRRNEEERYR